ncbi:unnamed protein product [Miscanthus lutarioriparius]|uniref:Uncharacterized protein n=1 Tax=Miscanthus lutarioriparius TaxID=422564 RepID=A0A811S8M8_9POAL|nr:unnamed protein product [Miscanthus lutarioriparius]
MRVVLYEAAGQAGVQTRKLMSSPGGPWWLYGGIPGALRPEPMAVQQDQGVERARRTSRTDAGSARAASASMPMSPRARAACCVGLHTALLSGFSMVPDGETYGCRIRDIHRGRRYGFHDINPTGIIEDGLLFYLVVDFSHSPCSSARRAGLPDQTGPDALDHRGV